MASADGPAVFDDLVHVGFTHHASVSRGLGVSGAVTLTVV